MRTAGYWVKSVEWGMPKRGTCMETCEISCI